MLNTSMKNNLAIVFIIMVFGLVAPIYSAEDSGWITIVGQSSARVVADPGPFSEEIGKLVPNTQLQWNGKDGDWFKIKLNGKDGFVHKDYCKITARSDVRVIKEAQQKQARAEQTRITQVRKEEKATKENIRRFVRACEGSEVRGDWQAVKRCFAPNAVVEIHSDNRIQNLTVDQYIQNQIVTGRYYDRLHYSSEIKDYDLDFEKNLAMIRGVGTEIGRLKRNRMYFKHEALLQGEIRMGSVMHVTRYVIKTIRMDTSRYHPSW